MRQVCQRLDGGGACPFYTLSLRTAEESLRDVPLIVCSADTQTLSDRRAEFERLGIYILPKPFSIDEVKAVVDEALTGIQPDEEDSPAA